MTQKLGVLSPEGQPLGAAAAASLPLASLDGMTIGEVYNNHFQGELMFGTYRRLFQERYRGVRIIPFDQFPIVYVGGDAASQKKVAKAIAALAKERGCDAIITGNGG